MHGEAVRIIVDIPRWVVHPKHTYSADGLSEMSHKMSNAFYKLSIVVVVAVLTLPHPYNAVRGHRTGSNNSEADDCLLIMRKTNINGKIKHTMGTE